MLETHWDSHGLAREVDENDAHPMEGSYELPTPMPQQNNEML